MYTSKDALRDIKVAIKSVRSRMERAMTQHNEAEAYKLMLDLNALQRCLEIETDKIVDLVEDEAA